MTTPNATTQTTTTTTSNTTSSSSSSSSEENDAVGTHMADLPPLNALSPKGLRSYSHHSLSGHGHAGTAAGAGSAFTPLLRQLIVYPAAFTAASASQAFAHITAGRATTAQVAAFAVALRLHGLDRNPEIVVACAEVMRASALQIDLSSHPEIAAEVVDIVGTGGDGHNTFNVSTAAAIVAAGAGCLVAKHGSGAASSQTGSADILEAVGCKVDQVKPEEVGRILSQGNFCFLYAPKFHPSLKNVKLVRREIGIPTIFNLLGPLANPIKPRRLVIGVHSPELGRSVAEALKHMGVQRAMVVCGQEGLDEISPAGATDVWNLYPDGSITQSVIHPKDFGLPTKALASVVGGHPARNASLLREILNSNGVSFFNPRASDIEPSGASVEEKLATLDFVLINAAALIVVAGRSHDFESAVKLARESLASGNARSVLEAYAAETIKEYLKSAATLGFSPG